MQEIRELLIARAIPYEETGGELNFRLPNGLGMFVRRYNDGSYDWSFAHRENTTNYMNWRKQISAPEGDALKAVREFIGAPA